MPTTLLIGGSSGIGLALARRLSRQQDSVHVVGRSQARVSAALAVLHTDGSTTATGHLADAADAEAVRTIAESIAPVDRLAITLSGSRGAGPFAGLTVEELRTAFDEKFWPTVTALQAVLPSLAAYASVTLVGAVSARAAVPGTAGIGSLNAAVEGLVQPLAVELAPIRVNAVSPGYVDTPWWDELPIGDRDTFFAHAASTLPLKRIATADEVADAMLLLATNPNITGTVIETDAGARLTA